MFHTVRNQVPGGSRPRGGWVWQDCRNSHPLEWRGLYSSGNERERNYNLKISCDKFGNWKAISKGQCYMHTESRDIEICIYITKLCECDRLYIHLLLVKVLNFHSCNSTHRLWMNKHTHTVTLNEITLWNLTKLRISDAYLAGVLATLGSQALPPCRGVWDGSWEGVI